ncbi:putative oxidation resistance protein 1 [Cladorrhinum sp. PSN259]|nr:putative oxidation resistance protein 1 [Cladorrhinum sp. PSN259]
MSFYSSTTSSTSTSSRNHHSLRISSNPSSRRSTPTSSGAATPTTDTPTPSGGLSSYLWSGLLRRFSSDTSSPKHPPGPYHTSSMPTPRSTHAGLDGVFTSPNFHVHRTPSPFLPSLEPLTLRGFSARTPASARLMTTSIAEEIRIMVPARLSLCDEWNLVYSLEQDGASLHTLYDKCEKYRGKRVGFVLCVRDCEGGIFGAYLSDIPHPAPNYFGTGECFLWRASVLAGLPPPPSLIDQTEETIARNSTISAEGVGNGNGSAIGNGGSIRFKAFPYSGVNEYYMLCEQHFISVGAGDGKFGLWLDDGLERGLSSMSQTFGNEPLSDEGEKFGVSGVELWVIGA